jgi:hypothetical protein
MPHIWSWESREEERAMSGSGVEMSVEWLNQMNKGIRKLYRERSRMNYALKEILEISSDPQVREIAGEVVIYEE